MKKSLLTAAMAALTILFSQTACSDKSEAENKAAAATAQAESENKTPTAEVTEESEKLPAGHPPVKYGTLTETLNGSAVTCRECHPQEFKDWSESHHYKAMMPATSETVLGDFNSTVTLKGVKSKFFQKDGKFFVNTQGADGKMHDFKVLHTFGVEPLQQYIVEFPNGKSQCLHIAWDTEKKKWFHLYPDTEIRPEEWLNWTGGAQNWNSMCADCHSTELKKNYDEKTDTYHTTWKEINVSCEACHGPADDHIKAVKTDMGVGEAQVAV